MVGSQIGAYLIERQLGRGGFGVVYVGVDTRLGRRAAIKQLLPELSGHRDVVERFFNEARAAANINHPGIVEIYDVGWHTDGSAYFAMKLLDGDSLATRLHAGGPLPIVRAATLARQVGSALVAAHAAGIIHRDLKPDNIILVRDDEVAIGERAVVLDFGIAKLGGEQPLSQKTRTGMMMGTPVYMSPEQCRGAGEVDQRTDVYALGCILVEMLAGRPPFVGAGVGEIVGMHQFVEAPALRSLRADAPAPLEALVTRALAKKPEQRPAMAEFIAALQPFTTGGSAQLTAAASASLLHVGDTVTKSTTIGTAQGEIAPPPRPRRKLLPFVLGGGVLAAGAVVAIIVASGSSPSKPTSPTDAAVALAADADAAPPIDAAIASTSTASIDAAPEASDPRIAEELAHARGALAERKWSDALAAAERVLAIAPIHAEARTIASRAKSETQAKTALADLDKQGNSKNYDGIVEAFARIEKDSIYQADARKAFDRLTDEFVAAMVRHARSDADAGNCAKRDTEVARLREHATKYAGKDNAYEKAASLAAAVPCPTRLATTCSPACRGGEICKKGTCVGVTTACNPACGPDETCTGNSCVKQPTTTCDFEALVRRAENDYNNAMYAAALAKFDAALACKFDSRIYQLAFLCACNSGNAPRAQQLYQGLLPGTRDALVTRCLAHGIDPQPKDHPKD